MRISAASCTSVHDTIWDPAQPATWLGASDSALYLITGSSTVLAVLTHDAVRLPGALLVPQPSTQLPLSRIAAAPHRRHAETARVGDGRLSWLGAQGEVSITVGRQWAPARVGSGIALPDRCRAVEAMLSGLDIGIPGEPIDALLRASRHPAGGSTAVSALLGRGPGLTPSGDDVLAGFILGCGAFGCAIPGIEAAVRQFAPLATTALSAQLLRYSLLGETVPEVVDFVAALVGRGQLHGSVERLLAIGHTSGPAMAIGVLGAARSAAPTSLEPPVGSRVSTA